MRAGTHTDKVHTTDKDRNGREMKKQNKMITSEESRWDSAREGEEEEEEGKANEREMKCEDTSGEKDSHCSLESISAQPPNHTYYLQDVKVLLFMCDS